MECFIEENCKRKINKACKKNPPLKGVLESKISEILSFPEHFKPLKNPDKGETFYYFLVTLINQLY